LQGRNEELDANSRFLVLLSSRQISDFGFAKTLHSGHSGASVSLSSGGAVGTYAYMSPELLLEDSSPDTSTDMWAMGVVLWELWTGKIPYEGMQVHQIVKNVGMKGYRLPMGEEVPKVFASCELLPVQCPWSRA
jgi:serine/threonine protein kinase